MVLGSSGQFCLHLAARESPAAKQLCPWSPCGCWKPSSCAEFVLRNVGWARGMLKSLLLHVSPHTPSVTTCLQHHRPTWSHPILQGPPTPPCPSCPPLAASGRAGLLTQPRGLRRFDASPPTDRRPGRGVTGGAGSPGAERRSFCRGCRCAARVGRAPSACARLAGPDGHRAQSHRAQSRRAEAGVWQRGAWGRRVTRRDAGTL